MKIAIVGSGFVGVVSAGVFASFGNEVWGIDRHQEKVDLLNSGQAPFFEPDLDELLHKTIAAGHLRFSIDYSQAIPGAKVVIVAVGTPSAPDGTADLRAVEGACASLAPHLDANAIVVIKSTVPPGTLDRVRPIIAAGTQQPFVLASMPEFLREGSAVFDTLNPDRVVIGCDDPAARETLTQLHEPLKAPVVIVRPESAQMGKYAANAYLATRITFINQIADLCDRNGADVQEVVDVIGYDKRIGRHYWYPGLGYGGSCFPKDVKELAAYSRKVGEGNNLFVKIDELNSSRIYQLLDNIESTVGGWKDKNVAVLGLSFKPNTDDLREAPSTKVIPHLIQNGATVVGHDPMALAAAKKHFADQHNISFAETIEETIAQADIILMLVEWPAYVQFDFAGQAGNGRWLIDSRNQLDHDSLRAAGWQVIGIGRPLKAGR